MLQLQHMTKLMEQAIERLRAIPESQQDQLAQFLLQELEDDDRWATSTSRNESALGQFVKSILDDDARGCCEPLDVDKL